MLQRCIFLFLLLFICPFSHGLDVDRSLLRIEAGQPSNIENVMSSSAWQPVQEFGNHGFTDDIFWLRLSLTNPKSENHNKPENHWVVKLVYPVHDVVDFYQIELGAIKQHWVMGDAREGAQWAFKEKHFAIPLNLNEDQATEILIRIEGFNSKVLGAEVKTYDDYQTEILVRNVLGGAFYGMLLIMGLYNLSLAFLVRDPSYYIYVAYVFLFGFLALSLMGDGRYFIWTEGYQFNHYAISIAGGLLAFPTIFFPYFLLDIPKNAPNLKKYFFGFAAFSGLYLISLFFISVGLSLKLINIINIVTTLFLLGTGIHLAIRKVPVALIYTLAWSFIITGLVILSLAAYNVLPMNNFTRNANLIGGLIEMVLLSIALAQRIHIERKAKLKALEDVATKEKEVEQQRKLYQQLFEQAPVGIFYMNNKAVLAAANPELCNMLNFKNMEEALNNADHFRNYFQNHLELEKEVFSKGTLTDRETTLITHDGVERICSVSLRAKNRNGDMQLEGYLTDISERKKAEEIRELMEKERMISLEQLVTGVAHEINTPLGVNITSVSNLKTELEKVNEKMIEGSLKKTDFSVFTNSANTAIDIIEENLRRITNLVRRFKMVSVQHLHSEKETLNVAGFSESLLRTYLADNPHIEIEVLGSGQLDVEIDPSVLNIIFEQLVENSLVHAFAEKEGGKITVKIEVDGSRIYLHYQDNGPGVDKNVRETVFNPFVTTRRGSSNNAGLGLYRVYNLVVQVLKGKIQITDEDGFSLRIEFEI